MSPTTCPRRSFLARTAAATAALGLSRGSETQARPLGANDRITLGLIGSGGRGRSILIETSELLTKHSVNVEVTAVCDLWEMNREAGVADVVRMTGRKPRAFGRHGDLLEQADVDGVIIATPDFWHVPVLLEAIKAGKDVYVEKPLAWSLDEAKSARDAVRASDRIVQVGTQGGSLASRHAAREFIKAGKLGEVTTAVGGFNDCGPRWRREDLCAQVKERQFDWEYYLRDRDKRPFDPRQAVEWRLWWDFSTGPSGLLGAHLYDAVQFVMDSPYPASAVAQGGTYLFKDGRETPDTFMTLIEYPRPYVLHYTTRLGNSAEQGLKLYGTRGTLNPDSGEFSGAGGSRLDRLPDTPGKLEFEPQPPLAHMRNFLDCMRTRRQPVAPIEAGYQHAVTVLLANAAFRKQCRMIYDPAAERIIESKA